MPIFYRIIGHILSRLLVYLGLNYLQWRTTRHRRAAKINLRSEAIEKYGEEKATSLDNSNALYKTRQAHRQALIFWLTQRFVRWITDFLKNWLFRVVIEITMNVGAPEKPVLFVALVLLHISWNPDRLGMQYTQITGWFARNANLQASSYSAELPAQLWLCFCNYFKTRFLATFNMTKRKFIGTKCRDCKEIMHLKTACPGTPTFDS